MKIEKSIWILYRRDKKTKVSLVPFERYHSRGSDSRGTLSGSYAVAMPSGLFNRSSLPIIWYWRRWTDIILNAQSGSVYYYFFLFYLNNPLYETTFLHRIVFRSINAIQTCVWSTRKVRLMHFSTDRGHRCVNIGSTNLNCFVHFHPHFFAG